MPLSPAQLSLHWREFAAAKRACAAAGHPEPDRHALYIQAGVVEPGGASVGGASVPASRPKSLTKFNNGDLDKVLAAFRALSQPANLTAQLSATEQPAIRLQYSIRELASQITDKPVHLADAYWQAIAHAKFGLHYPADSAVRVPFSELSDLSLPQLTQLRDTLESRLASKRRSSRRKEAQTLSVPADDNVPF